MDQYFSQQAALLARNTFDTPDDVVSLLDSSYRPEFFADQERKHAKTIKVGAHAYKLDNCARWKEWVAKLGIRLFGLRYLSRARLKGFVWVCNKN